ncbi:ATP-binding cassette domain-containing protein [Paenibacillus sediminis]|uniref:ABC-2 type transport system ATP-binding protein n=1 Tax=Paenibacillus sediminis TaxID=664909 RepID=A0ABS4H3B1_9BACL|nr:ATP-binding cassette domain-containing protein [Paenibacillus sediminis]MBP1936867.1 ABC-2 type transport system ATP-binding protein [Paenibacillus sediminis]
MDRIVEIERLTKTFSNKRGIHDISLNVQRGDVYGFFGPNGAGKTTVMKMMTGLSRADQGKVRLFGHDVATHYEQAMAKVGVLIETAEAYEYMSGRKNLELAASLYPELARRRVDEVLELVGLSSVQHEKVGHYSLGMKQRLGLASAILSKPELLILDEPTNGLDIEGMVQIREIIMRLAREEKITFFISSHLIYEMELMCNRIGILSDGKILTEGILSEQLKGRFATLEEFFLHEVNKERGTVSHA